MKKGEARKRLQEISVGTSNWIEKAKYSRANRDWLDKSAKIALKILKTLDEKNISQKQLAETIGVSPQQISKIVKGHENLTLQTISKLEKALDVKLISISEGKFQGINFLEKTYETFQTYDFLLSKKLNIDFNFQQNRIKSSGKWIKVLIKPAEIKKPEQKVTLPEKPHLKIA